MGPVSIFFTVKTFASSASECQELVDTRWKIPSLTSMKRTLLVVVLGPAVRWDVLYTLPYACRGNSLPVIAKSKLFLKVGWRAHLTSHSKKSSEASNPQTARMVSFDLSSRFIQKDLCSSLARVTPGAFHIFLSFPSYKTDPEQLPWK